MALVTTSGAADANSYATAADLAAYVLTRPFVPAWYATGTDATKEAALRMAARLLDSLFDWTGSAVDATQALTWPRNGMFTRNGFAIETTTIPTALKEAQCEFALMLAAGDRLADNDALKQGITSVKAGSVAVTFKDTDESSSEAVDNRIRLLEQDMQWASNTVPDAVRQLLVPSWFIANTLKRPLFFEAL